MEIRKNMISGNNHLALLTMVNQIMFANFISPCVVSNKLLEHGMRNSWILCLLLVSLHSLLMIFSSFTSIFLIQLFIWCMLMIPSLQVPLQIFVICKCSDLSSIFSQGSRTITLLLSYSSKEKFPCNAFVSVQVYS